MKKYLIIVLSILSSGQLLAQTWDEWFHQAKTQKKYLLQQIAALEMYAGYASKGYSIAKDGLGIIGNIKNGDFSLHNNYFTSLVSVSPQIKKYQKVSAIITMQASIVKLARNAIRQIKAGKQFTPAETSYTKNASDKLLDGCGDILDALYSLIANGNLQMKDDERLQGIDKLYEDMQDKQTFIRSFIDEAKAISAERIIEANGIIILKKLNGLP